MSTPPTDRSRITITQPDDWHLHLRDGEAMAAVLPATARRFRRAIVMPNLKPPITSVAAAQAYRERILAAREQAAVQTELELKSEVGYEVGPQLEANAIRQFEPLMTLYPVSYTHLTLPRRG